MYSKRYFNLMGMKQPVIVAWLERLARAISIKCAAVRYDQMEREKKLACERFLQDHPGWISYSGSWKTAGFDHFEDYHRSEFHSICGPEVQVKDIRQIRIKSSGIVITDSKSTYDLPLTFGNGGSEDEAIWVAVLRADNRKDEIGLPEDNFD